MQVLKLKKIEVLANTAMIGNNLKLGITPFLNGEVFVKNQNTLEIKYGEDTFVIRVDEPLQFVKGDDEANLKFVNELRNAINDSLLIHTENGKKILSRYTLIDNPLEALNIIRTYNQGGVKIEVSKNDKEEWTYTLTTDLAAEVNKTYTDSTEFFCALGWLGHVFSTTRINHNKYRVNTGARRNGKSVTGDFVW